jgi:hypothetical protein
MPVLNTAQALSMFILRSVCLNTVKGLTLPRKKSFITLAPGRSSTPHQALHREADHVSILLNFLQP